MPSELRYIMFDTEEVRTAIWQWLAAKSSRIDPAAVGRVALFTVGSEVVADLHSTRSPGALRIRADDLMTALLAFCRQSRIPLPRLSAKSLQLSEGRLVLVTGMNPAATAPRVVDGKISYAEWAVKEGLPG